MTPLRVLLIDDAVVVRRVLGERLARDPMLEIIGAARDGRDGLEKLSLNPDIIVLDVEMPELDGLGVLDELRRRGNRVPVLMFSSVTVKAAEMTLNALSKGACDYVTKPTTRGASLEDVVPELISKLKLHGLASRAKQRAPAVTTKPSVVTLRRPSLQRPKLVLIASSTGGPIALGTLLSKLPARLPVPTVVVQHMPNAVFTAALAQSLAKLSRLPVEHAEEGAELQSGVVSIAPGGSHLTLQRKNITSPAQFKLNQDPPLNGVRPAADALFASAASLYGPALLAVVLTGMGQDGLRGAEAVTKAGGSVMVQDEATSVIWGMPGAVAKAGLASAVVPLPALGAEIGKRFGLGEATPDGSASLSLLRARASTDAAPRGQRR